MKKIISLLFILVFFSACKPTSNIITSKKEAEKRGIYGSPLSKKENKKTSRLVTQLIHEATDNLGVAYKSGGITPEGFDCSGLMYATFKKFDIILPRSSVDMSKMGKKINTDEIQKGDLIFFKTNGRNVINHVGMVIEVNDDEIKFIHSSTQKGVIISSTKEAYYGKSFTQANRIM